jgi:hypothetical protein
MPECPLSRGNFKTIVLVTWYSESTSVLMEYGDAVFLIAGHYAIKRSFEGQSNGLVHRIRQYLLQIRPKGF